jgi:hypothetical protein
VVTEALDDDALPEDEDGIDDGDRRRWREGQTFEVSGIRFRVVRGTKFRGDLRLDWWTGSGWRPLEMAVTFLTVDFFTENEAARGRGMRHWRQSGERYFLNECRDAVRKGWEVPTRRIVAQQRR